MAPFPVFVDGQIEPLARVMGECCIGSFIDAYFSKCGVKDESLESTKWKRIAWFFSYAQKKNGCANNVIALIQDFLSPPRFVGRLDQFEVHRKSLNQILLFSGLEFGSDGKFYRVEACKTLDEAQERVNTIQTRLGGRNIHLEVTKYCRAELLQENYFHAVFEATKGLAQRIRDLSKVQLDGAALVDRVFSIDKPILTFNALGTESEKSEHKGFAALLKGCFGAVRNPSAHTPKILWEGEDDAADYLTLISLLHRKLDGVRRVESV